MIDELIPQESDVAWAQTAYAVNHATVERLTAENTRAKQLLAMVLKWGSRDGLAVCFDPELAANTRVEICEFLGYGEEPFEPTGGVIPGQT